MHVARYVDRYLFPFLLAVALVVSGGFFLSSRGTAAAAPMAGDLVITGVIDGPLTGGVPKGIELYVLADIPDLSIYGVGSANNGGGSDGEEFSFPSVNAVAGDYIYIASETTGFNTFFGFNPDYVSGAMAINGDDAIELFMNDSVVDTFGDINASGLGTAWDYTDGWAYRNNGTGPDGSTFVLENWYFSGPDALDGATSNATAAVPFPIGTYTTGTTGTPTATAVPPTPTATPEPSCGAPATFIHEVQGSGDVSPIQGNIVTIEGIVVGDFQDNDGDEFDTDLDGFYVQEEAADFDTDEATSEGIFVFAPAAFDVVPGDVVRLTGEVTEFDGLTELTDVTGLELCGTAPLPDPVDLALPVENVDDFEKYEGMLVEFPQTLVISEYFNFDRFNEVVLTQPLPGEEFLHQPTAIEEPGSPQAAARAAYNQRSRITLDDARSQQNPDPTYHPNGQEFTLDNRFRGGDYLQDVTGILDDRFGLYRIQPTAGATYIPQNPRPAEPAPVGGSLTVASFNVLNYFLTIDSGPDICGPNLNQDCRGADNVEEFERQRAKILDALLEIDADIYGLIEMENTTGVEPLADIVDGLNDVLGAGTYDFIDTGVIGPDAIRQGIIYKPGTVTPLGNYAVLDTAAFLDPNNTGEAQNRPPVVQSFTENSSGGVVTVVVNHLKSKGSACGAGDDDPEQGNCNVTRTLAAEMLVEWLATDPTGSGDPDYLIIGDLNAYDKEDPIDAFREGADDLLGTYDDYTDLLLKFEGEYAYSYVFDGQVGYLDYAMSNAPLTSQVTGTTAWHINADEPDILDYDTSFKQPPQAALYEPNAYRSSDHDPIIVGLNLATPVLSLQYNWDPGNGTGAQQGEWTLFSNRTFVDSQGNVGLWAYQPSQYRLTLSYGPGQQCTALLTGTFRNSTTLAGRSVCRDGSNAQGIWGAQIVQGTERALEAAEASAPAAE